MKAQAFPLFLLLFLSLLTPKITLAANPTSFLTSLYCSTIGYIFNDSKCKPDVVPENTTVYVPTHTTSPPSLPPPPHQVASTSIVQLSPTYTYPTFYNIPPPSIPSLPQPPTGYITGAELQKQVGALYSFITKQAEQTGSDISRTVSNNATLTTSSIAEGTNLYYTDARVASLMAASTTVASSTNYWTKTGNDLSYSAGKVGIGTTTPNNNLDIYSSTKPAIGFSAAPDDTFKWTIGMNTLKGGRFTIASTTAVGSTTSGPTVTSDKFVIDGNGSVGIGNVGSWLPDNPLTVRANITKGTGIEAFLAHFEESLTTTQTIADDISAIISTMSINGTHLVRDASAVYANLVWDSTNTTTGGGRGQALLAHIKTSNGTAGAANYLAAVRTSLDHNSSGNIGAIYGLYVPQVDIGGSGTITDVYGSYIGNLSGAGKTNVYGYYSSDVLARNILMGKLGIGTTTPSARLAITQSANTAAGGLWIAETGNTDFRSLFMDTAGTLSFFGGNTAGTLNTATLSDVGAWINASDRIYKENIADLNTKYSLSDLMKLEPRFYTMKGTGKPQIGFIAQEVKAVIPEVVEGEEGSMGISYGNLVTLLAQGIKELANNLSSLSDRLAHRVDTEQLCIGKTCLTEAQLQDLLSKNNEE